MGLAERDAYEVVGATLVRSLEHEGGRIVLVTSAIPGEGKTTVTANLGVTLARDGHRVLLVSADLRDPALGSAFGLGAGDGLRQLLGSPTREALEKLIIPVRDERDPDGGALFVLPPGTGEARPSLALEREDSGAFLDLLRETRFDYVLVDSAHLVGVSDSYALAESADDVVVVVNPGVSHTEDLRELRAVLDRLDVAPAGLVVLGASRVARGRVRAPVTGSPAGDPGDSSADQPS